jgi:hypothetical protein
MDARGQQKKSKASQCGRILIHDPTSHPFSSERSIAKVERFIAELEAESDDVDGLR